MRSSGKPWRVRSPWVSFHLYDDAADQLCAIASLIKGPLNRFGARAYLTTCHSSHKQIVQAATQQTIVRAMIGRNATTWRSLRTCLSGCSRTPPNS
jgi:hypothetical protein